MTELLEPEAPVRRPIPLQAPQLPRWAPPVALFLSLAAAGLVGLLLGWGPAGIAVVAWVLFLVGFTGWAQAIEGRRKAVDRMFATLIWSTFVIAMVPLVSVTWEVVSKGHGIIGADFFANDMRGVLGETNIVTGEPGGIKHALVGTLMITLTATAMAVPVGVMAAIYLVEYGKRTRFARTITFLVDVMTGIPSIVAGLFAFSLLTLIFGAAYRSGFGGSVALAVIMVPIVVRATEEMLKLVPDELREASYALGVPKWRTIVKVVLPTAFGGIATGVTLAVARVAGETAPLLIIAGSTTVANWNVFEGRMMTLPVFIYSSVTTGGKYAAEQEARAWGAALVLVVIVMSLNLLARLLGKIFSPKTGR
ncbi:phosphate ABC transporter permease PtsA [Nocardioides silvaticus]|uniref:Phosphate transport system permease protein PstA n=1 Tax=Nocardioides silvaticus TaxID=2201891 RepID=A0A316TCI0_9ACTN|nr:phosphate ABC transporter permease PstA [Nocardioides silvaticus]PWN01211.1 phosphate ABC transporter permease PtsA [Nocardioides silvaticus]